MKFTEIDFQGCYLIEIDKTSDVRGNFFRTWDKKE